MTQDTSHNLQNQMPPPASSASDRRNTDHDAYFNSLFSAKPLYVTSGEIACSRRRDEMFVATLGSGVAATFFDIELKLGAICYTVLPDDIINSFPHFKDAQGTVLEKACEPIHNCINEMKKHGAGKNRIRVRLFGGTTLPGDAQDKGTKNYIFVREYLARKGIAVMNEDLGGPYLRRLHFFPATGRSVRCLLRRQEDYDAMRKTEMNA